MDQYARAKQVDCPVCEASKGKPCQDMREGWWREENDRSSLPALKRPHKQRVAKADGGMSKKRVIEGQLIQWHLPTAKYDICPTCNQKTIVRGQGKDRYCTNTECKTAFFDIVERG